MKQESCYLTTHPTLLDGLPRHWKNYCHQPWFPYVMGALAHPDPQRRSRLLHKLGIPDMPPGMWRCAVSSLMLCLTYQWPPLEVSGTDDAWNMMEFFLQDKRYEPLNTPQP